MLYVTVYQPCLTHEFPELCVWALCAALTPKATSVPVYEQQKLHVTSRGSLAVRSIVLIHMLANLGVAPVGQRQPSIC